MDEAAFKILSAAALEACCRALPAAPLQRYQQLQESELAISTFSFYASVPAVVSSKLEGKNIELASYCKTQAVWN